MKRMLIQLLILPQEMGELATSLCETAEYSIVCLRQVPFEVVVISKKDIASVIGEKKCDSIVLILGGNAILAERITDFYKWNTNMIVFQIEQPINGCLRETAIAGFCGDEIALHIIKKAFSVIKKQRSLECIYTILIRRKNIFKSLSIH